MKNSKFYSKVLFASIFIFLTSLAYATDAASQKAATYAKPLFHSTDSPVAGNPNGDITIVDFFDYQCTHCGELSETLNGLVKKDPNVRIVFKELPILGEESEFATKAALAAQKQHKYLEFHHQLMALGASFTQDQVLNRAKHAGLDMNRLKKDMDSKAVAQEIKANLALSQKLGIHGTPTLVIAKNINDLKGQKIYIIPGALSEGEIKDILHKLRAG